MDPLLRGYRSPFVYKRVKGAGSTRTRRNGWCWLRWVFSSVPAFSVLERRMGKQRKWKRKRQQQLARRYAAHWLDLARRRKRADILLLQLSLSIQNAADGRVISNKKKYSQ